MTPHPINRRTWLQQLGGWAGAATLPGLTGLAATAWTPADASAARRKDPAWERAIDRGLKWVARTQSSAGHWTAQNYPTAMTALAGTALICSGSTTTQGPYAKNIRRCVDYLIQNKVRQNGLIGDPNTDQQYTYGHGFSMLFLSQVLGEEEDAERRQELLDVLNKAVKFSGQAQTRSGGWGYVSAKDGNDFDEGSTTITQVQGLRGCRNAGIPVPAEVIDRAKEYIYQCKNADGGISYSFRNRGSSRPAITAAALAALYNAGDYDGKHVPEMLKYCKQQLSNLNDASGSFGHWHYTYVYYSQVIYRQGPKEWETFRDKLYAKISGEQSEDGKWDGAIGPIYVTACNLIMLQLDRAYLPIYQR
ncbi:MAG: prenyltransferase/squalene oxidase repeat-containing protein [Pirellulales bacterium]